MITVVLIGPEHPGNVGAIVRSMKNFEFDKLVIVNPTCDPLCTEAKNRAKHANDVLESATITTDMSILDKFDYRIGTTGLLGSDYNLPRTPFVPKTLAEKLDQIDQSDVDIAIVFGRESSGLSNEEIELMDYVVTIPTGKYHALNLSHAVTVILYELFQHRNQNKMSEKFKPIRRVEIDVLTNLMEEVLSNQDYLNEQKIHTQKLVWKHILTKSMLTKRESFALMGFFRKCLGMGVTDEIEKSLDELESELKNNK